MKSATEVAMKNRKQELTATVLAIFTTLIIGILSWIAGFGSPGGCIFFGAIVSVAEISIYFYMDNREDTVSRKVYAIIGAIAIVITIFLILCVIPLPHAPFPGQ